MGSSGGMGRGDSSQPFVVEKREEKPSAPSRTGGGMSLGSKTNKKSALAQVLKEEQIVEKEEDIEKIVSGSATVETKEAKQGPVHVEIEEKMTVTYENDGGLENLVINGTLVVHTNDTSLTGVSVTLQQGDNDQFQLKTHPKVDKQAFTSGGIIKAKDAGAIMPSAVMKWRLQTSDDALLPLSVSCWPSKSGDQTQVTMEYELLNSPNGELHNVSIVVPVPGSQPPVVSTIEEGNHEWDGKSRNLTWRLHIIDSSNKTGSLEFSVPSADPKGFFPVNVGFTCSKTFCDLQVQAVTNDDKPVKHTESISLSVDDFKIV